MNPIPQRARAFTLLELMVVVAVIAILMSFATYNLVNSRVSANEGAAVAALRTITSANQQYKVRFGRYAAQLSHFSAAGYVDNVLGQADSPPGKSGYVFSYAGGTNTWTAAAQPLDPGSTGRRYFYVSENGVIHFSETGPATTTDQPIE